MTHPDNGFGRGADGRPPTPPVGPATPSAPAGRGAPGDPDSAGTSGTPADPVTSGTLPPAAPAPPPGAPPHEAPGPDSGDDIGAVHEHDDDRPTRAENFSTFGRLVTGLLRAVMGFYFLWAFVDKTFGLEYSTPPENGWVDGGSPTTGFLSNVDGPFAEYFQNIAGQQWVDWLFMVGLLGIGLALLLGIGVRIAAFFAFVLLIFMYLASLPPATNPLFDDHIIQALAVLLLGSVGAGSVWGLGKLWRRTWLVSRNRWLI